MVDETPEVQAMASQVRSSVTRRKILDAAVDVFNDVGYAAAGRSAIIERIGMTKGALYHHFDSMESLASAVIDEGSQLILDSLRRMPGTSAPALENMVHATFMLADLFHSDKMVRTAEQLVFAQGRFNESAGQAHANWLAAMAGEARRAIAEGDLQQNLDPDQVSETILGAMLGTRLLAQATSSSDLIERLRRTWELLLPAIVTDSSLDYFREFVAREVLRATPSSIPPAD